MRKFTRTAFLSSSLLLVSSLVSTALAQVPVVDAIGQPQGNRTTAQPQPQVEQAGNTGTGGSPELMMQLYQEIEQLKRQVQNLQGTVEQQSYQIRQMQTEQRDRYLDLDRRLSELTGGAPAMPGGQPGGNATVDEPAALSTPAGTLPRRDLQPLPSPQQAGTAASNSGGVQPVPPSQAPAASSATGNGGFGGGFDAPATNTGVAALPATPENEQEVYKTALDLLLNESRYEESIAGFDRYIQAYPNGRLLPNAYYWQGEALILAERYVQAEQVLRRVVDDFPADPKAADAMLKLGDVYERTGNSARARETWMDIRNRYPASLNAIRAAEAKLQGF